MEQLTRQHLTLTTADVRRNLLLPLRTERDFDRLVIRLHYSPKAIREPEIIMPQIRKCVETYFPKGYELTEADMTEFRQLFNFVTLSLDRGQDYVGCAHRHDPEQTIVIGAEESSRGFAPTPATAGDWRIVLHVQAVVVGTIDYQLAVYGMERGESDAAIPAL